jgi:hypothetical protein
MAMQFEGSAGMGSLVQNTCDLAFSGYGIFFYFGAQYIPSNIVPSKLELCLVVNMSYRVLC